MNVDIRLVAIFVGAILGLWIEPAATLDVGAYEVDNGSLYDPGLGGVIAGETAKPAGALFAVAQAKSRERKELFNGKDLSGWKLFVPEGQGDPKEVWSVRDGVIHCTGKPAGYIRTTTAYENYRLTLEWRWPGPRGGNSGLLLHIQEPDMVWPKSIEGQMQYRQAADFWLIGGAEFKEHVDKSTRRVVKMQEHNEKPIGEWNQYEAICEGDTILLYVNGLLQNKATECTLTQGYIGLQSEGTAVEFRSILLEPLEK